MTVIFTCLGKRICSYDELEIIPRAYERVILKDTFYKVMMLTYLIGHNEVTIDLLPVKEMNPDENEIKHLHLDTEL